MISSQKEKDGFGEIKKNENDVFVQANINERIQKNDFSSGKEGAKEISNINSDNKVENNSASKFDNLLQELKYHLEYSPDMKESTR